MITPLPSPPEAPGAGGTSARDRELAQYYLNAAMNYLMAHDRPRAIEHLARALVLDPALAAERYTHNLIEQITGMSRDDALPALGDPVRLQALIAFYGGKRALRRQDVPGLGATWPAALRDLAILALVLAVCALLAYALALRPLQVIAESWDYRMTARIAERLRDLRAVAPGIAVLGAVGIGAGTAAGVALQFSFVHTAAVRLLAGEGTLPGLLRRAVMVIGAAAAIGTLWLVIAMQIPDIPTRLFAFDLVTAVGIVLVVVLLCARIGEHYGFRAMTGCTALLYAGLLQGALSALAAYALLRLLG